MISYTHTSGPALRLPPATIMTTVDLDLEMRIGLKVEVHGYWLRLGATCGHLMEVLAFPKGPEMFPVSL